MNDAKLRRRKRDYDQAMKTLKIARRLIDDMIEETELSRGEDEVFFGEDLDQPLVLLSEGIAEALDDVEMNFDDIFGTEGWARDLED